MGRALPGTGKHGNVALFVPHAGCPHRCSFCDQRAIAGTEERLTPDKVEAACLQAESRITLPGRQAELAFFGGSFTALPKKEMCALLDAALPVCTPGCFQGGSGFPPVPTAWTRGSSRPLPADP